MNGQNKDDDEDEDAEEVEQEEDVGSDDEGAVLKKINDARSKKKQEEEELPSDDEDDSDYEYTGGDLAIYDSALDKVDELLFIKDALERLNGADSGYTAKLLSAMTPEEYA